MSHLTCNATLNLTKKKKVKLRMNIHVNKIKSKI